MGQSKVSKLTVTPTRKGVRYDIIGKGARGQKFIRASVLVPHDEKREFTKGGGLAEFLREFTGS